MPNVSFLGRRVCAGLLAIVGLLQAGNAKAETPLSATGFSSARSTHSVAPFEHVDPFSGNLLLTFTDLVLPGNAGFNLVVQRTYNSKIHPDFEDTSNIFKQRTWVGLGWSLHFGRVVQSQSLTPGEARIEMSDGSGHPLYNALPAQNDPDAAHGNWVTSSLWRYRRPYINGQGTPIPATAKLPNGLVYEFGHIGIPNGPDGVVLYVTRIQDPYGNALTFEYFPSTQGPTDGVKRIVQHLGNGQTREVTFGVTPILGGYALASMTYDNRTWTYTHSVAAPSPYDTLVILTGTSAPVAGNSWSFTYREDQSGPGPELLTVTGPLGGQLSYTYANVQRPVDTELYDMRTISERRTIAGGVTTGLWTFNYVSGTDANTTVIVTPCGRETYTYLGIGTLGGAMANYAGWNVGALKRSTTETLLGQVLEERTFAWIPSAVISDDSMEPTPEGFWGYADVVQALPDQTVVNRGGQKWYTDYSYSAGNFNDYLQANQIQSWDETRYDIRRVVNRQFWAGAASTLYVRGRVTYEDVFVGSEWMAAQYTYQSATGFLTQTRQRAQLGSTHSTDIVTSFTRTTQGNIATITDPANKVTTFAYTWGVQSEVVPAISSLKTTRVVAGDGTVTSETLGILPNPTLTTTYTYDALMRPISIQPPGNRTPTTMAYLPDQNGWLVTTRGTEVLKTDPDEFGRVLVTQDADGFNSRVVYDGCGRVTFQSAPYDTGLGTRGVTTNYDALGRVVSTVAADGATTSFAYTGIDVTVTDAIGRVTSYDSYSDSGPGGAQLVALTDAAGKTTTYTYHISGALASTAGDVAGTRTWTYDTLGRVTSETHPEAGTTTYVPNKVGGLTSLTNAAGQQLTFTYDNLHRMTNRNGPGTASDVTIAYDLLGRVASESVAGQLTTTYTYDPGGRPITRTDTTGGVAFVSEYTYDPLDNLTTLKYPSWNIAGYTYAPSGRLTAVTWNGQPFATFAPPDSGGRLTSYTTGPVTHEFEYDTRDRMTRIEAHSGAAPTALDLTYAFNNVSLVTGITDVRPGHSQVFTYDAVNRLISADGAYGALTWQYDAAGNRTVESRPGGSLNYTYNVGTRRLTSVSGPQAATFTYDAAGRTTGVASTAPLAGTTTYAYSPSGLLTSVTTSGAVPLVATQVYDASEWRIRNDVTVNGVTRTSFTPRGLGGQVLSEYVRPTQGQTHEWVKDTIYAGGRALGAYTMPPSLPTVDFLTTAGQAMEGLPVAANVRVTVPGGGATTSPITVTYRTVDVGGGTATPTNDYVALENVLNIPAGTANGAVFPIGVATVDDTLDDIAHVETVLVRLTAATGASVGAQHTFTHQIQDDEGTPQLTVTGLSHGEGLPAGNLTLQLSHGSEHSQVVLVTSTNGSAVAPHDFAGINAQITFGPGDTEESVAVTVVDDSYAERPSESFTVQVALVSGVLVTPGPTTVSISDDDGPWVDIDSTLPGDYFARAWWPGEDSYLQIYNPHSVAVTVRITYIGANGTGVRREHWIGVGQRLGLHVPSDPFVSVQTIQGSAVVQSLGGAPAVVAEVVGYAGSGWQAGDASEGVMPASSWTFAEGATGLSVGFQEWVTVFNPSSEPVTATLTYYGASGPLGGQNVNVPSGPGLYTVYVNNNWTTIEHSTVVTAVGRDSGQPVPIVAERRMRWNGSIEGHSSAGQTAPSGIWEFPEGGNGLFQTYIALFNPHAAASTVRLYYRHENGNVYSQDVVVGAQSRATIGTPGFLPAGAYATEVYGLTHAVYAERVVYAGTGWTIGHASPGSATAATTWRFAEGSSQSFFDTYFILINQSGTSATVTLTYRNVAGGIIGSDVLTIPGYLRGAVWANAQTGGQPFTTEVSGTQLIVAERVMYWPTGSGSSSAMASPESMAGVEFESTNSGTEVTEEPLSFGAPEPYTLTPGVQGPTLQMTEDPASLTKGKPTPGSTLAAPFEGGETQSLSGLSWYGSHLAVGKKP